MSGKILVTGASGFVGRRLVRALAEAGLSVRAATRAAEAEAFPRGVEVVAAPDLTQPVNWTPLVEGIGKIVHLAAIAHSGARVPEAMFDQVNRAASTELAAAAARNGVKRLVFMSSVRAQAGPASDRVLTERDAPCPTDAYGRSKHRAEAAIRASGVPATILRPVLIYGPGVKGNLASLLRLAASPWPLPCAAFANRRSILGLDNLVAAVRLALDDAALVGETYLVADPQPLTLPEIVTILRAAAGRPSRLFALPPRLFETALTLAGRHDLWERLGGSLVVDPAKLLATGWRPVKETKTGLAEMVAAARGSV